MYFVPVFWAILVAIGAAFGGLTGAIAALLLGPLIMAATCFAVLGGLHLLLDAIAKEGLERELRKNLPPEHYDAIVACIERAKAANNSTLIFDLTAPVVMWFVLPFVSHSANKLPRLFAPWDNEVSMNGDSGGILLENGQWQQFRDTPHEQWPLLIDRPQLDYSHPDYEGDAYYARGHHPRSFAARYIWLGLRNRATAAVAKYGVWLEHKPELVITNIPGAVHTYQLFKYDDYWHYLSNTKVRVFGKELAMRRNLGYKLGIVYGSPEGKGLAIPVYIPISFKCWK